MWVVCGRVGVGEYGGYVCGGVGEYGLLWVHERDMKGNVWENVCLC